MLCAGHAERGIGHPAHGAAGPRLLQAGDHRGAPGVDGNPVRPAHQEPHRQHAF